jgi:ribosome modulation factor
VQGYAAGATAKEHNSFDAFDKGYRAGQTAQDNMQSATNSALAYDNGYQAGIAASNAHNSTDQQQAFNQGYTARGLEERNRANRAFDNGYEAGTMRHDRDLDYP